MLRVNTRADLTGRPSLFWRGFTVLCVLLLLVVATALTVHSHPLVKTSDRCQICFALHSPALASASQTHSALTALTERVSSALTVSFFDIWHFDLANRPPPLHRFERS